MNTNPKLVWKAVKALKHPTIANIRESIKLISARGEIGACTELGREMSVKIADRRINKPTPSVREVIKISREKKSSDLFCRYSGVPSKSGAGELFETISLGENFGVKCRKTYGSRSSVANSYGYPVFDHIINVTIPAHMDARIVNGVFTVARFSGFAAQRAHAVPCTWPTKSAGYSVKLTSGWLYRGRHITAKTAALAERRVSRDRADAARKLLAARASKKLSKTVFIGESDLLKTGACAAGIAAARREIENLLGADGPIGGVLASYAINALPGRANFVTRAVASKAQA